MIKLLRQLRDTMLYGRSALPRIKAMGAKCIVHRSAKIVSPENIVIGDFVRIGPDCHLDGTGGITIGDGTIFGPNVTILTASHNYDQTDMLPYNNTELLRSVTIGRGVWCGRQTMIVPGVSIGDGAVLAAGAVVTRNVDEGTVVGGNPAKIIKTRSDLSSIADAIAESRYYLRTKGIAEQEKKIATVKKKSVD